MVGAQGSRAGGAGSVSTCLPTTYDTFETCGFVGNHV